MTAGAFGFIVSSDVFATSRNPVGGERHEMKPQFDDAGHREHGP